MLSDSYIDGMLFDDAFSPPCNMTDDLRSDFGIPIFAENTEGNATTKANVTSMEPPQAAETAKDVKPKGETQPAKDVMPKGETLSCYGGMTRFISHHIIR